MNDQGRAVEAIVSDETISRKRAHVRSRAGRDIALTCIFGWFLCLIVAAIVCRSLYADGAYAVVGLLRGAIRYNDYDPHRTFASFIVQSPVLLGRRLGIASMSTYARLYSLGVFVLPAAFFLYALWLARHVSVLCALTVGAIAVFGFGANFINSEANLFLGAAWLAVIILALPGSHPLLRGFVLPVVAFGLSRMYEGMLLAGPILALWAFLASMRTENAQEKIGLTLAVLLFALGALVGFGGFVTPRDPDNASSFADSAFAYLGNPQLFALLSTLCALAAMARWEKRDRWPWVGSSALLAAVFIWAMVRQEGYYAYGLYHENRSFLVLSLPLAIGALLAVRRFRPEWILKQVRVGALACALIPFFAVVTIDLLGSGRWYYYVADFCAVLDDPSTAEDGITRLKHSGAVTGWEWTHPQLSILLRKSGSAALVRDEPGEWQPPDINAPPPMGYRGVCENRFFAKSRPVSAAIPR